MIIKNKVLEVQIDSFGAEVKSIKKNDQEFIWQGDPKYWKRSSPVLFPIVGRLLDDEYKFEDKTYRMTQHGFARDNQFKLIHEESTKCEYILTENTETLKSYPFKFELIIGYEVKDNVLNVSWKVKNTNKKDMYFQIGAHPAFNFVKGSVLSVDKTTNVYNLNNTPYIHSVDSNIYIGDVKINDDTFINDALVYDNIDEVTLCDLDKKVTIKCENFPYIGIWSKYENNTTAPFVCLEPWHGIADCAFHDKKLINKKGINVLKANEEFKTNYQIIVK